MTRLIDPNFDPLQELMVCQHQIRELQINLHRLVEAHNEQGKLVQQLTKQNTELLNLLNSGLMQPFKV